MAEFYSRLARYYDTDENDPRIFKLTQKLLDKGIDPTQWIDSKIGKRTEPLDRMSTDPRQDTSSAYGNKPAAKDVAPGSIKQGIGLPPTEDERLGIDNGLAEPGLAARAIQGAANPQQRRQFLRGVSDTATFGLAEKAGNLVGLKDTAEGDAKAAPDARDYGEMLGAVIPGATGAVGRAAGGGIRAASRLGAQLGNMAGGGVGAMVGGGIGGAVGGAVAAPVVGGLVAGGQAAVNGPLADAPRAGWEAAKATAGDPLAMASGVGLGALGGVSTGIRAGNTRTGEDIRAVEEFGGKPGPFRGASGGAFDEAPLKGRRGTTGEVGEVAREAGDTIRKGLNARTDKLQADFGEGKRRLEIDDYVAQPDKGADFMARRRDRLSIDDQQPNQRTEGTSATRVAPRPNFIFEGQESGPKPPTTASSSQGGQMLDTAPIRSAAEQLLAGKRLPNSAKSSIRSEVLDVLDDLPEGKMSVSDLNDFRGKLQDISKVGEPTAKSHFRTLYKAAKDIVDETEYGQLNAGYSKGIEAQKRAHRQLGLGRNTSRTEIDDPIAAKKAARVVRRQDENTATAGQESIDVQKFIQENPEFAQALASSRLLSAKGRLRLGMPESGGLYERVGGLATRNIEPILGGGVYPVGKAVGGAGAATAPSIVRILEESMAQQRKRDEERSRMFTE